MAAQDWSVELRRARKALRLSQRALADLAGVAPQTVKAYEHKLRHPSRALLTAVLDALKLERGGRNQILMSAGFAPDGSQLGPDRTPGYMLTLDEATQMAECCRWPSFVLDEFMEVLAANSAAQRLWGVDLRSEFTGPLDRNLLGVASNPRFADRCVNWSQVVGTMVGVFKGHHRGPETFESPSSYLAQVLEHFLQGDPKYVRRFLRLWEATPPTPHKIRWSYPVVWQEPGIGRLRFDCFVSVANEPDGLAFNDWIPLDADTWVALETIRKAKRH